MAADDDFMFWVTRKDPDDTYLMALVTRMYNEDRTRFPPKLLSSMEAGRVSLRTMWKEEEKRTYVWLQPA
jgi:hypothetical protein